MLDQYGINLTMDQIRPSIQGNLLSIHAAGKAKKGRVPSVNFELDLVLANAEPGELVAQGVRFSPSSILRFDIQSRAEERLGGKKINDLMFEGLSKGMEAEGTRLSVLKLNIEEDNIHIQARGGPDDLPRVDYSSVG